MKYTAFTVLALSALAAAPRADAQTVHEHVRTVVRAAVEPVVRYQRGGDRQEQTERVTRTLKIGSSGELDLANIAGDIVVTRGGGTEARIEIVKTARGRTVEDAREMLGLVQVEVNEGNGRGDIKTRYPSSEGRRDNRRNINVSVAYTVTTPAATRLTIRSISGNIRVDGVAGDLSLETVSGYVDVARGGRITAAKSISGDVTIADSPLDGSAEAGSVSGTVAVRRVQARRLSLSSISGNIVVDDAAAERIEAQSMSGNVEFQSALLRNGRYELKSHSGDVRVTVLGATGFELEANSWSGSVRADVANISQHGDTRTGRERRRSLRGTVGDGSAVLSITTFSGSAVVSKR